MRRATVLALAVLWVHPAIARDLPQDVRRYAERREGCNHWAGEEPYDKGRRIQIEQALSDLDCRALDSDERALKRRYWNNPAMLRRIREARDANPD